MGIKSSPNTKASKGIRIVSWSAMKPVLVWTGFFIGKKISYSARKIGDKALILSLDIKTMKISFLYGGLCALLMFALPLPGQSQKRNRAKKDSILLRSEEIVLKPMDLLNTSAREVNLCITPDGQCLLIMSGRGQMPWSTPGYTYLL